MAPPAVRASVASAPQQQRQQQQQIDAAEYYGLYKTARTLARSYQAVAHQKDDQVKALTREMEELKVKLQQMEAQQQRLKGDPTTPSAPGGSARQLTVEVPAPPSLPSTTAPNSTGSQFGVQAVPRNTVLSVRTAATSVQQAGRGPTGGSMRRSADLHAMFTAQMLRYNNALQAEVQTQRLSAPQHEPGVFARAPRSARVSGEVWHGQLGDPDDANDPDTSDANKAKKGKGKLGKAFKKLMSKSWRGRDEEGKHDAAGCPTDGSNAGDASMPAPVSVRRATVHGGAGGVSSSVPNAHSVLETTYEDAPLLPISADCLSLAPPPRAPFKPPAAIGNAISVTLPSEYLLGAPSPQDQVAANAQRLEVARQRQLLQQKQHQQFQQLQLLQSTQQTQQPQRLQQTQAPQQPQKVQNQQQKPSQPPLQRVGSAPAGLRTANAGAIAVGSSDTALARQGSIGVDLGKLRRLQQAAAAGPIPGAGNGPSAVSFALQPPGAPPSQPAPTGAAIGAGTGAANGGKASGDGTITWTMLVQRSALGQLAQRLKASVPGARRSFDSTLEGSTGTMCLTGGLASSVASVHQSWSSDGLPPPTEAGIVLPAGTLRSSVPTFSSRPPLAASISSLNLRAVAAHLGYLPPRPSGRATVMTSANMAPQASSTDLALAGNPGAPQHGTAGPHQMLPSAPLSLEQGTAVNRQGLGHPTAAGPVCAGGPYATATAIAFGTEEYGARSGATTAFQTGKEGVAPSDAYLEGILGRLKTPGVLLCANPGPQALTASWEIPPEAITNCTEFHSGGGNDALDIEAAAVDDPVFRRDFGRSVGVAWRHKALGYRNAAPTASFHEKTLRTSTSGSLPREQQPQCVALVEAALSEMPPSSPQVKQAASRSAVQDTGAVHTPRIATAAEIATLDSPKAAAPPSSPRGADLATLPSTEQQHAEAAAMWRSHSPRARASARASAHEARSPSSKSDGKAAPVANCGGTTVSVAAATNEGLRAGDAAAQRRKVGKSSPQENIKKVAASVDSHDDKVGAMWFASSVGAAGLAPGSTVVSGAVAVGAKGHGRYAAAAVDGDSSSGPSTSRSGSWSADVSPREIEAYAGAHEGGGNIVALAVSKPARRDMPAADLRKDVLRRTSLMSNQAGAVHQAPAISGFNQNGVARVSAGAGAALPQQEGNTPSTTCQLSLTLAPSPASDSSVGSWDPNLSQRSRGSQLGGPGALRRTAMDAALSHTIHGSSCGSVMATAAAIRLHQNLVEVASASVTPAAARKRGAVRRRSLAAGLEAADAKVDDTLLADDKNADGPLPAPRSRHRRWKSHGDSDDSSDSAAITADLSARTAMSATTAHPAAGPMSAAANTTPRSVVFLTSLTKGAYHSPGTATRPHVDVQNAKVVSQRQQQKQQISDAVAVLADPHSARRLTPGVCSSRDQRVGPPAARTNEEPNLEDALAECQQHYAATVIQAHWRSVRARRAAQMASEARTLRHRERQHHAAVAIQRAWNGARARAAAKQALERRQREAEVQRQRAAEKIQMAWHSYRLRLVDQRATFAEDSPSSTPRSAGTSSCPTTPVLVLHPLSHQQAVCIKLPSATLCSSGGFKRRLFQPVTTSLDGIEREVVDAAERARMMRCGQSDGGWCGSLQAVDELAGANGGPSFRYPAIPPLVFPLIDDKDSVGAAAAEHLPTPRADRASNGDRGAVSRSTVAVPIPRAMDSQVSVTHSWPAGLAIRCPSPTSASAANASQSVAVIASPPTKVDLLGSPLLFCGSAIASNTNSAAEDYNTSRARATGGSAVGLVGPVVPKGRCSVISASWDGGRLGGEKKLVVPSNSNIRKSDGGYIDSLRALRADVALLAQLAGAAMDSCLASSEPKAQPQAPVQEEPRQVQAQTQQHREEQQQPEVRTMLSAGSAQEENNDDERGFGADDASEEFSTDLSDGGPADDADGSFNGAEEEEPPAVLLSCCSSDEEARSELSDVATEITDDDLSRLRRPISGLHGTSQPCITISASDDSGALSSAALASPVRWHTSELWEIVHQQQLTPAAAATPSDGTNSALTVGRRSWPCPRPEPSGSATPPWSTIRSNAFSGSHGIGMSGLMAGGAASLRDDFSDVTSEVTDDDFSSVRRQFPRAIRSTSPLAISVESPPNDSVLRSSTALTSPVRWHTSQLWELVHQQGTPAIQTPRDGVSSVFTVGRRSWPGPSSYSGAATPPLLTPGSGSATRGRAESGAGGGAAVSDLPPRATAVSTHKPSQVAVTASLPTFSGFAVGAGVAASPSFGLKGSQQQPERAEEPSQSPVPPGLFVFSGETIGNLQLRAAQQLAVPQLSDSSSMGFLHTASGTAMSPVAQPTASGVSYSAFASAVAGPSSDAAAEQQQDTDLAVATTPESRRQSRATSSNDSTSAPFLSYESGTTTIAYIIPKGRAKLDGAADLLDGMNKSGVEAGVLSSLQDRRRYTSSPSITGTRITTPPADADSDASPRLGLPPHNNMYPVARRLSVGSASLTPCSTRLSLLGLSGSKERAGSADNSDAMEEGFKARNLSSAPQSRVFRTTALAQGEGEGFDDDVFCLYGGIQLSCGSSDSDA